METTTDRVASPTLTALAWVIQALEEHEVSAVIDPRNAAPPCAILIPRVIEDWQLCGDSTMGVDLVLIARDSGVPEVYRQLDTMLDKALTALEEHGIQVDSVHLDEGAALSGTANLPSYRITIQIERTQENG